MKLWKKLSLICGIVLVLAVTVCCAALSQQTRDEIMNAAYGQAADKQRNLALSFQEMLSYYSSSGDSRAVERSLVSYCFTRFADSTSVLTKDGETLYSQVDFQPEQYLAPDDGGKPQHYLGSIGGRQVLIVGSSVHLSAYPDAHYAVFVSEDVTDVYESITELVGRFALIGAVSIAAGLCLIILLVRRAMQPLDKLQATASRIAGGDYKQRSDIRTGDEVGALAKSFNLMAESVEQRINELTETAQRQKLFIGAVSHEFKTPLTTIILNADTLQNTYLNEDERERALTRIEQQSKWLERMVQKLLKLVALDNKPKLQSGSVPELLESVRQSAEESLRSRGVMLNIICGSDDLKMDADLMHSALINLVENAGKASSAGQRVTLAVHGNVIEVTDEGCGIPPSELERITEPFYMADASRSKKQGGTGLGLALVKKIADAHGGALEIESTLGAGTTARIRLPE